MKRLGTKHIDMISLQSDIYAVCIRIDYITSFNKQSGEKSKTIILTFLDSTVKSISKSHARE